MTSALQQLIRARRSIRRFKPDPVEKEKLLSCLEEARLAPSAENAQPTRFLVVDNPELKDELARVAFSGIYSMTKFAAQAPVLVVVLARLDILVHKVGRRLQGTEFFLIDVGIAGEHFVLRAEELGLSTCWIGWFNRRAAIPGLAKSEKISDELAELYVGEWKGPVQLGDNEFFFQILQEKESRVVAKSEKDLGDVAQRMLRFKQNVWLKDFLAAERKRLNVKTYLNPDA